MTDTIAQDDTRERLLQAAGQEFARVGFERASVRDICSAAGANISAIKYHFGGKEALYMAVWEVASGHMQGSEPMPTLQDGDDPEVVLRAFIAWFMRLVIVDGQKREWTGRLLSHEMLEPTPAAFRPFVERCCRRVRDELLRLVKAISRDALGPRRLDHIVYALSAMCTSYKHYERLYHDLGYEVPAKTPGVNSLAAIVGDLAIGGIRSFRVEDE